MLQIDLKPSNHVTVKKQSQILPDSNPNCLNAYNSLNRANRIRDLARIVDDNKQILNRLQSAGSYYSTEQWNRQHDRQNKMK